MITAEVRKADLEAFRAKVLGRFPAEGRAAMKAANKTKAERFKAQVEAAIPAGKGELAATLVIEEVGDLGYSVSIGGPAAPYPLHLDAGHMSRSGGHVPANPFWFSSRRFLRAVFRGLDQRARKKAVQSVSSPIGSL